MPSLVLAPVTWVFAGLLPLVHLNINTGHSLIRSLPLIVLSTGGATVLFMNIAAICFLEHELTIISSFYLILVMGFLNSMVLSELHCNQDLKKSLLQRAFFISLFSFSFFSSIFVYCTNLWGNMDPAEDMTYIVHVDDSFVVSSSKIGNDICLRCVVLSYVFYYLPVFTMLAILFYKWIKGASKTEACAVCSKNRPCLWYSCVYLAIITFVARPIALLYTKQLCEDLSAMYMIIPIFYGIGFTYLPHLKETINDSGNVIHI
ncbi:uncharacterized protein LOC121390088 isoform X2 [Gigantopelta aegis]|nr:uncharacterized protein LOC121390088 isoform X2 [Gigantopelta aegis]